MLSILFRTASDHLRRPRRSLGPRRSTVLRWIVDGLRDVLGKGLAYFPVETSGYREWSIAGAGLEIEPGLDRC
jgi:hypothetical protein